ncbi:MAG: acyl-CoA thioesterase [Cyanobacteria bacterium SZAS LIN-3]|nr:acyl-CoA thioesterase [Cyanobacteria bacterium SZAS LIN-3]MBS2009632.1 acyl-CoA thioesterase [Cyanobacteria bacterium SZAS TMP-1]
MTEHSRAVIADRKNYKFWTSVTLRYGDTDKLGHVNNAVFATICEAGRAHLLFNREGSIAGAGKTMVLANLNLDFLAEMHFPGTAEVGTAIDSFGKSSLKLFQCIYKDDVCCGISRSTIVLIDEETRKPIPYSEEIRRFVESEAPLLNVLV